MRTLDEITIVYAEDDVQVRKEIVRFLQRRVKDVYEANNGKEGLELTKEFNPDAVITDIEMPEMNGLEMIKKIREEVGSEKPIIVVTGYEDEEHYSEEADAYLYKPIGMRDLIEALEKLI